MSKYQATLVDLCCDHQWIRRPTTGNDSTIDYTLARAQFGLADGSPVTRALVYIAAPMRWQLHVNGQVVDTQDDYQLPRCAGGPNIITPLPASTFTISVGAITWR